MFDDLTLEDGLLALVVAALTWLFATLWYRRRLAAEVKIEVAAFQQTLIKQMEWAVTPAGRTHARYLAAEYQAALIKQLTHYHTPRIDWLLAKVGSGEGLTDDEDAELMAALEERTQAVNGIIDQAERDAAHILPYVIHHAKAEKLLDADKFEPARILIPKNEEGT